jgi:hypothetical protein
MRKWFFILSIAALCVVPISASAQGQIAIASINVSLWPEYDQAKMLVINSILLSENSALPAQFNVRIPVDADLHTVAVGATSEAVSDKDIDCDSNKNCTMKEDGDWLVISINATGPAIQLEYYDNGLKKDGTQRSYSYRWLSDYNVANFGVLFQQPFDADQFKSSLSLQDDGIHPDKMQYYFTNVGAVPAGKTFTFDLSYQKPTDDLSVSHLQIESVNVDENTPGRVSLNNYLPYMIGGLGVIMILGGLLYYRRSGRAVSKKSRRRHTENEGAESGVYCAQCGTRARGGDRFCRTCGSRLRQSEE